MTRQFSKLPYYNRLGSRLEALNEFVTPRAVLRYQSDIVSKGSFSLPSPWTGERLQPLDCYLVNLSPLGFGDIQIAYRFKCEATFWLISGIVKDGFPLNELFVPAWNCSPWSILPEQERQRNAVVREQLRKADDEPLTSSPSVEPPVLLLGHPNFAHNLWNELPGLAVLEKAFVKSAPGLEVMTLCQPMLSIEQGFASLDWPHKPIEDLTGLLGRQSRIFTRVGSTQVSGALRAKLDRSVRVNRDCAVTDPILRQLQGHFPVIWVSARLDCRTALNQEDLITAAVLAIADAYPKAGFVLDGFAYPDDFDNPIYMLPSGIPPDSASPGTAGEGFSSLGASLVAREREITPYISQLQQKLKGQVRSPVVSTSGLRMTNAIYIGKMADYYICHAGSLQHKVGWIHNSIGIVHSNSIGLGRGAARWMARQVENGAEPMLIDQALVSDLDSIRSINQVERNRDYQFVDIPGVVSQILEDMARRMPERQGAPQTGRLRGWQMWKNKLGWRSDQ